jgi:hypothetical protein
MKHALILLGLLSLPGCGAVLAAGAMSYRDSLAPGQQRAFKADFDKRNADRQATGQPPLEWCTQLKRYNLTWYRQDATCR